MGRDDVIRVGEFVAMDVGSTVGRKSGISVCTAAGFSFPKDSPEGSSVVSDGSTFRVDSDDDINDEFDADGQSMTTHVQNRD